MTTTTTYSPGDRVRTRAVSSLAKVDHGKTGTVDTIYPGTKHPFGVTLDDGTMPAFSAHELEPLPDPTDPASIPTGEVPPITSADIPGLHVVSDSPVTLVREPAVAPSSSQAGLASFVPLRETVPPEAARDVMAGAGIDLDVFDAALAQAREAAEEDADRPALAAYDDGHAQGHRDGLIAALRIVERMTDEGIDRGDEPDPGGLIRAELLAAIKEARP